MDLLLDPLAIARIKEFATFAPELPGEVVTLFASSTAEDLAGLAEGGGDRVEVERTTHRMCSTALAAGATALGERCRAACAAARGGEPLDPGLHAALSTLRDETLAALEKALGDPESTPAPPA